MLFEDQVYISNKNQFEKIMNSTFHKNVEDVFEHVNRRKQNDDREEESANRISGRVAGKLKIKRMEKITK